MSNQPAPQWRRDEVSRRAATPAPERPRICSTIRVVAGGLSPCTRRTQRSAGNGLSDSHCKRCVEFHRRHGSHWRRSYLVRELAPYREASRQWIRANRTDPQVARVVSALDAMIADSGKPLTANAIRGKPAEEKARNVLARLREAEKTGEQLLLITLTIKATIAGHRHGGDPERQQVQIAKMIHRLASGTHIRSAIWGDRHIYPRAEGSFMRTLGHQVEDIAGIVADSAAVEEVLAVVRAGGGK